MWRFSEPRLGGAESEESEQAELFYQDMLDVPRAAHPREGYVEAAAEDGASTTPIRLPAGFRLGVWVDVGGRHLQDHGAAHAARLQALGFTDACVMVNDTRHRSFGFHSASRRSVEAFARLLRSAQLRLTLTTWLRPDRRFIDDLLAQLPSFATSVGAHAIEFDVEEPWTRVRPVGFASHDAAAEYLFSGLRSGVAQRLETAITPQVDATPGSKLRALVANANLVIPQAYSVYLAGRRANAVGGVYGPRGLQDRALQKVAEARRASGTPMIMGLAAYRRSQWPGQSSAQIMRMELAHTASLASAGVQGARYWSWKHIAGFDGAAGRPANRYANRFFAGLRSSSATSTPPRSVDRVDAIEVDAKTEGDELVEAVDEYATVGVDELVEAVDEHATVGVDELVEAVDEYAMAGADELVEAVDEYAMAGTDELAEAVDEHAMAGADESVEATDMYATMEPNDGVALGEDAERDESTDEVVEAIDPTGGLEPLDAGLDLAAGEVIEAPELPALDADELVGNDFADASVAEMAGEELPALDSDETSEVEALDRSVLGDAGIVEDDAEFATSTGELTESADGVESFGSDRVLIGLRNDDGSPAAGVTFQARFGNGRVERGQLDAQGQATISDRHHGDVQVTFPALPGAQWRIAPFGASEG